MPPAEGRVARRDRAKSATRAGPCGPLGVLKSGAQRRWLRAMAARCDAESPGGDVPGPEAVGTVRFLGSGASSGPDFAAYKTESLKNPSRPVCYWRDREVSTFIPGLERKESEFSSVQVYDSGVTSRKRS